MAQRSAAAVAAPVASTQPTQNAGHLRTVTFNDSPHGAPGADANWTQARRSPPEKQRARAAADALDSFMAGAR
jgi:hypothetical protein